MKELEGEGRIAGRTDVPEGKYPSLARVERKPTNGERVLRCVASILDRHWILSTATCFIGRYREAYNVSVFTVIVGDSIRNETEPYERIHAIERYIVHERVIADR